MQNLENHPQLGYGVTITIVTNIVWMTILYICTFLKLDGDRKGPAPLPIVLYNMF